MSVEGGVAGVSTASDRATRRSVLLGALGTALVWLLGSAVVVVAQHGSDRRIAALAAAGAGVATILVLGRLTADPGRRYLRSVFGATIVVSVVSDWALWHLHVTGSGFELDGLVKRITLPLLIVLLAPLVVRALWAQRATVLRPPRGMDWIVAAYATVILLPALAVGLQHHNRLLYVAQDLGLILFFTFTYLVGRAVSADAARAAATELVGVLLLLAAAQWMLVSWEPYPLYSYYEAAAAAALAVLVLRPRQSRILPIGLAVVLLAVDVQQIRAGTNSSTAIELAGALGIVVYVALRSRRFLPQWLLVAIALLAVAGVVGLTRDGTALRGAYRGPDQSNVGTTYEAHRVRAALHDSRLAPVLGRGLGGTIDESTAPYWFKKTLLYGGRDLAHVQEVHLLPYAFLLKAGFLGLAWLAAFLAGLAILAFRALERAAREREPGLVLYAALPLLGIVQAFAASSRLQASPLNGLALGILVTCLGPHRALAVSLRTHRRDILGAVAVTLAGCGAIAYLSAHQTPATQPVSGPALPNQPISLWIGDSYTAGAGARSGRYGEAVATSVALGWQMDIDAEGGTGFVSAGPRPRHYHGKPVPARVAADASSFLNVDVVVIDAGRNDRGYPLRKVHRAVVSSFNAVAKDFPYSAVVVIAPFLMKSTRDSYLPIRRLLRRQAEIRRWAFVDPIGEGWINRASARLMKRDHIHPNQKGYDYIVAHLAPAIDKALAAAHEHARTNCSRTAPCRRRAPRR